MQILGVLGMYFDAVVVDIEKYVFTFFSDWVWSYCVQWIFKTLLVVHRW